MKEDLILEAINGLSRRIEKLDDKIDNNIIELKARIDEVEKNLNTRIDKVENDMNSNFKGVGMALNTAMLSLNRKIENFKEENESEHQVFRDNLKLAN